MQITPALRTPTPRPLLCRRAYDPCLRHYIRNGCAHSSFRTCGPWSPARRGASPPNPPAYLTQCLILLLNSISHTLAQLAGAVYSVFYPTTLSNVLYTCTACLCALLNVVIVSWEQSEITQNKQCLQHRCQWMPWHQFHLETHDNFGDAKFYVS